MSLPPVTPEQAAANRALLAAELREYAKRSRPGRALQPCGTLGAYRRHERDGEAPCRECRDARYMEDFYRYVAVNGRAPAPRGNRAERDPEYAHLRGSGLSPALAAKRAGVRSRTAAYAAEAAYQQARGAAA